MNSDRQSRLPDYVGKKIVEALKQDKEEAQIFEDSTNTFVPKSEDAVVDIHVKKTVKSTGAETISPEGFEFVLENVTDETKYTVKSNEKGLAVFTLTFTEEDAGKVYDYVLAEINDGRENVTYSTSVYEFQITVASGSDGKLTATVSHANEVLEEVVAEFENIYGTGEITPTPDVPVGPGSGNTGDDSPIGLYISLMIECVIAVILVVVLRKHRKQLNKQ